MKSGSSQWFQSIKTFFPKTVDFHSHPFAPFQGTICGSEKMVITFPFSLDQIGAEAGTVTELIKSAAETVKDRLNHYLHLKRIQGKDN